VSNEIQITDNFLDEILELSEISKDLKKARSASLSKIQRAIGIKLSYDHYDSSEFYEYFDEFEEEMKEALGALVTGKELKKLTKEEFKSFLEENPDDRLYMYNLSSSIKEIQEMRGLFDDSSYMDDEFELATATLKWISVLNYVRVRHDIVPLVERGLYAELITELVESWNKHKDSDKSNQESFWQGELSNNAEVLGRVLGGNIFLITDKPNCGATDIEGRGSKVSDFVFKHKNTQNITLVEIKTPDTPLLGSFYGRGAYPLSRDLSGSVAQVLIQRNELMTSFYSKVHKSEIKFEVHSPRCFIITGRLDKELYEDEEKLKSFEIHRGALSSNVSVITFDELYSQISSFNKIDEI